MMVKKDYVTTREFDKFAERQNKTLDKIINNDLHHLDSKVDRLMVRVNKIEVRLAMIMGGIAVIQILSQK